MNSSQRTKTSTRGHAAFVTGLTRATPLTWHPIKRINTSWPLLARHAVPRVSKNEKSKLCSSVTSTPLKSKDEKSELGPPITDSDSSVKETSVCDDITQLLVKSNSSLVAEDADIKIKEAPQVQPECHIQELKNIKYDADMRMKEAPQARPERLMFKMSIKPSVIVIRQPKGPGLTMGFKFKRIIS